MACLSVARRRRPEEMTRQVPALWSFDAGPNTLPLAARCSSGLGGQARQTPTPAAHAHDHELIERRRCLLAGILLVDEQLHSPPLRANRFRREWRRQY